jgi:hypothetical protein
LLHGEPSDGLTPVDEFDRESHYFSFNPSAVSRLVVLFSGILSGWTWRLFDVGTGKIERSSTISFKGLIDVAVSTIEVECGVVICYFKSDVLATPRTVWNLHF